MYGIENVSVANTNYRSTRRIQLSIIFYRRSNRRRRMCSNSHSGMCSNRRSGMCSNSRMCSVVFFITQVCVGNNCIVIYVE